jgi:hypothetical protein
MTISVTGLLDPMESNASAVEIQFAKADLIAAYQLRAAPTRRRWTLLLMSVLVLAAVIFMYSREISQTIVAVAFISFGGALGALAEFHVYVPWRARRDFAKSPLAHLEHKFTLLSEGITIQNVRGSISRLQWNDFLRWRTNKRTTIIFLSPTIFIHFPARLAELGFPVDRLKDELSRALGPPF